MENKTPNIAQLQKSVKDNTFKLPTIAEIYAAGENMPVLQQDSVIQVLLNQAPRPEWLKAHPIAKKEVMVDGRKQQVPISYIPIERIEWLLTNVFVRWKVEIKNSKLIANSIVVEVRLHYYDHVMEEWHWQDGIGAQPLQTDKDSGAVDFNKIKSNAVQIAAPAAESYAVKDAAEKIGKLFGKDLNRAENNISYESLAKKYENVLD